MIGSLCLASALLVAAAAPADDDPKPFLHGLFSDHMVLQRDVPVPVWGWAEPGQKVNVAFAGKSAEAVAGADGKWTARLGPSPAGGPFTLEVTGPKTATLQDVLVGDVWICSGQSNMEWVVANSDRPQEEIAAANHPNIRLYTVPKRIAAGPCAQVKSDWKVCSPETVGGFSAVGYFFGRDLERELGVPIGLINSSWGGTVAQAWVDAGALAKLDDFRPALAGVAERVAATQPDRGRFLAESAAWSRKNDPGQAGPPGWADPGLDDSDWKSMDLPRRWEDGGLPDFDGIAWFRKEVILPDAWAGKALVLDLGPIDDRDATWVNGAEVGRTHFYLPPRQYAVPAGLAKAGRNVIAVSVLDVAGNGGINGKAGDMRLRLAGDDSEAPIPLAGAWKYKVAAPLASLPSPPQEARPNPNEVTVLSNGMIAPLVPFALRGAIWYQGESNASNAAQYRRLLPALINDWRDRFGVGRFPFYIVSLANFMNTKPEPAESSWAELREAQYLASQAVPNSAVALAIDIGDAKDIHPRNKQDVGRRLALDALALTYGRPVEYSGPVFQSATAEGNALRLSFDHTGGGLVAKGDGPLKGFAVAGEDGKFAWADAKIDGDAVVVSSPKVEHPRTVRYAWVDNPEANFANKAGLPALPFRSDAPR